MVDEHGLPDKWDKAARNYVASAFGEGVSQNMLIYTVASALRGTDAMSDVFGMDLSKAIRSMKQIPHGDT